MRLPPCIAATCRTVGMLAAVAVAAAESIDLASTELRATVRLRGAELASLQESSSGHEYLWQDAAGVWAGPAPVLFPIVGALRTGSLRHGGRDIPMAQHGFVRTREFTVVARSPEAVTLELQGGGDASYPWPFRIALTYALTGRTLAVQAVVENPGPETLPFSLGFHPGFNATLGDDGDKPASSLTLSSPAPIARLLRRNGGKLLSGERTTWSSGEATIALNQSFATPPATVLACAAPVEVRLEDHVAGRGVTLRTDAPFLGLWRPAGAAAQFLCLEPWWGTTDPEQPYGDFTAKPHLQQLPPGKFFTSRFTLQFH